MLELAGTAPTGVTSSTRKTKAEVVASHPDCAAGDLQLHKRTLRMRVHGVRTDSFRALMRRPTQE